MKPYTHERSRVLEDLTKHKQCIEMGRQLKERIFETIQYVTAEDIGIAFSGGVDSCLLAKACYDLGKNVRLITIGISSQRDITISKKVTNEMNLGLFYDLIQLEDLEKVLRKVIEVIRFDRIVRLENCVCFYYVFRMVSRLNLGSVLSANGIDELFCGYDRYREIFGNKEAIMDLMKTLIEIAKNDKEEIDKISSLFNIKYICPFLSERFVDYSMNIPIGLKMRGKDDRIRKHIIRQVATNIGVPKSTALTPKKAFQYSSGIHKSIRKLAKMRGHTKKNAKTAGFRSEIESYINSLKQNR